MIRTKIDFNEVQNYLGSFLDELDDLFVLFTDGEDAQMYKSALMDLEISLAQLDMLLDRADGIYVDVSDEDEEDDTEDDDTDACPYCTCRR